MKKKYRKMKKGECWICPPIFIHECCRCGLKHEIRWKFVNKDGKLEVCANWRQLKSLKKVGLRE